MDNRGSKSITYYRSVLVKEQRVDGYLIINIIIIIRCTLVAGKPVLGIN